jgi:hypothetical protein
LTDYLLHWINAADSGPLTSCAELSHWLARPGIALGAGELTLQVGKGSDDLRRLKGSVASTNGDLLEDARIDQPLNRFIGLDEASAHHFSRAVDRDNWCADKNAKE